MKRGPGIQSSESSNRIEGITARYSRIEKIVIDKVKPQDRSEQEIAGYRDVLYTIHVDHGRMKLSSDLLLGRHGTLGKYTKEKTGVWKPKDNAILEVRPEGRAVVRFKTVSALATPEFTKKLISHYSRLTVELLYRYAYCRVQGI